MTTYKLPISVLVVIYTRDNKVLLLERRDHPGYWQSVTGSCQLGETLPETAHREVLEETGLDTHRYVLADWNLQNEYEIYSEWRHRYEPGVLRNKEHVFGLELPETCPVQLNPREHLAFQWLTVEQAARAVFSPSNKAAIEQLAQR